LEEVPPSRWFFAVAALLLLLQAAFVASEVAFLATGAVRVRRLEQEGGSGARILGWLSSDRSRLLATVLMCITALGYAAESLVTFVSASLHPVYGHYIGLAAVLAVSVVFVEALPVIIASKTPDRVSVALAPIAWLAYWVLWPVVTLLSGASSGFLRLVGAIERSSPTMTEAEVISLIEVAEVEDDEKSMLRRVLDFEDRTVEEVMVPRTDMLAIEDSASVDEAAAAMVAHRHSRLPVYHETRDRIVGIVFSKDLLAPLEEGRREEPVSLSMREPLFIHEKTSVQRLVEAFRREHRGMALVTDEFGGIAGLVTLEDALEELVGEIQDEFDHEETGIQAVGEHEFLIRGTEKLHDVMRELVIDLPEGEYETISGLVTTTLGHLAREGESVDLPGGVRIEVVEAAPRRVRVARLIRPATIDLAHPTSEGQGESRR
jgi:putative hemolysin